jgi:hypothetical protein
MNRAGLEAFHRRRSRADAAQRRTLARLAVILDLHSAKIDARAMAKIRTLLQRLDEGFAR